MEFSEVPLRKLVSSSQLRTAFLLCEEVMIFGSSSGFEKIPITTCRLVLTKRVELIIPKALFFFKLTKSLFYPRRSKPGWKEDKKTKKNSNLSKFSFVEDHESLKESKLI